MNYTIEYNEEAKIVLVLDESNLDPNGQPTFVQYTFEEWEQIKDQYL